MMAYFWNRVNATLHFRYTFENVSQVFLNAGFSTVSFTLGPIKLEDCSEVDFKTAVLVAEFLDLHLKTP